MRVWGDLVACWDLSRLFEGAGREQETASFYNRVFYPFARAPLILFKYAAAPFVWRHGFDRGCRALVLVAPPDFEFQDVFSVRPVFRRSGSLNLSFVVRNLSFRFFVKRDVSFLCVGSLFPRVSPPTPSVCPSRLLCFSAQAALFVHLLVW